jgi:2,4-dienoyl-CoA reductase-like NADH-dependent reductase (Old Yellow Enzyme family)
MGNLFSPLIIAGVYLQNRIVMSAEVDGYARLDGFISDELYHYYLDRVHGGVALIIMEPVAVFPPDPDTATPHIGLYDDAFVPELQNLVRAMHGGGVRLLVRLEAHADSATATPHEFATIREHFIRAAWRVRAAGCDGVLLSAANGGVLQSAISPLLNQRSDEYGGSSEKRLRLAMEIIEGIREWMGPRLLIGFRLIADDLSTCGLSLQDTRLIARRLAANGVNLLDVTADAQSDAPLAHFPGWHIPLVDAIKRVVPDLSVIGSGLLDDPHLADSVVRDGSLDLVMLDQTLDTNPYWPKIAQIILLASQQGLELPV